MENSFAIVESAGKVTLEKISLLINISAEDCKKYRKIFENNLRLEEIKVYDELEKEIDSKYRIALMRNDVGSRRIINTYSPTEFESDWCVSLIHMFIRNNGNHLNVYQRSMESKFFLSDIGFYVVLANKYNASLSLMIGSFHFIVGGVNELG